MSRLEALVGLFLLWIGLNFIIDAFAGWITGDEHEQHG